MKKMKKLRRYVVAFDGDGSRWHCEDDVASVIAGDRQEAETLALNAKWYDGKSPRDRGVKVYDVMPYELSLAESYSISEAKFEKWFTLTQNIFL